MTTDAAPPVDGTWTNDAGSRLTLKEHDGALTGTYFTALGDAKDEGEGRSLTGWRNGRCVGFSVSWGPAVDGITAWTGLLSFAGSDFVMSTVWTLVRSQVLAAGPSGVCERPTEAWEAFLVQSAKFRRST